MEIIHVLSRDGAAYAVGGGILSAVAANPRLARAALSGDLDSQLASCGIATAGAGKIPFICFDLAGGANIAGSNVLIGQEAGQRDFLGTGGYERQGLPGDMIPGLVCELRPGPRLSPRFRVPSRHPGEPDPGDGSKHQRRRHPRPLGQRHRQ
jgi:hypothetical protein